MGDMADKIEDIAIALVLLAILVGQVAIPVFTSVNVSTLNTTQALVWGFTLTFAILGIGLMMIRSVKHGKKR
jgi:hypothetical protein